MELFQNVIMYLCLGGIIAIGTVVLLWKIAAPCWELIKKYFSTSRIQQVLVGVFVIGMIHYGATKNRFTFEGGIKDNGSVATNSTLSIRWQRDTSQGVLVPLDAVVYIDYRNTGATGEVWQTLAQSVVGNWQWNGIIANATNYDYNIWAYYIPPEPVHTNGVWLYKTLKDRNEKFPIPLRVRIECDGKAIATPAEKRKDDER